MKRACALFFLAAVPLIAASFGAAGEKGAWAVQIVYESDTRGYYLPCG